MILDRLFAYELDADALRCFLSPHIWIYDHDDRQSSTRSMADSAAEHITDTQS